MASGGITFGVAKTMLAPVVENGIDPTDPRVLSRTNEATKAILDELIPVNGMLTADVMATGTTLLLPKELENAIEVEVLGGATVRGSSDIAQGWYDIVNNFVYIDPSMAHDNPLIDQGLVPDPVDPRILRRQYEYPGLQPNSTVRVTGAKRFVPLDDDADYLIVQNIRALKLMIQSIESEENNDPQQAEAFHQKCIKLLTEEVKKHLLDPRNHLRRKSEYFNDTVNFKPYTFGWMRANLALEVPGGLTKGKVEISFTLNMAEKRIIQRGLWKDMIREYSATLIGGNVALPLEVESVLAVDLCGHPIPVRSTFLEYIDNGPGQFTSHPMFVDKGEQDFVDGRRRVYAFKPLSNPGTLPPTTPNINLLCRMRWLEKGPNDFMVIRNFDALRLMMAAIFAEEKEDWEGAQSNMKLSIEEVQRELDNFLKGVIHTPRIQTFGFGLATVGGNL